MGTMVYASGENIERLLYKGSMFFVEKWECQRQRYVWVMSGAAARTGKFKVIENIK